MSPPNSVRGRSNTYSSVPQVSNQIAKNKNHKYLFRIPDILYPAIDTSQQLNRIQPERIIKTSL